MIKSVIFDCFGVLCQGSLEYFVSQASPENLQSIIDTNRAADHGYIDHTEYVQTIAEILNKSHDEIDEIVRKFHIRNESMFEVVRSLKDSYKLGLLSNVGNNVIENLFTEDELNHLFDTVVLSGAVGMAKPSERIFQLTAERLHLSPEECVMIDDLPRNVEAAESIGMQGIVCSSPSQVKRELDLLLGQSHA
jgi:glucose-1-phosphatase